MRWIPVDYTKIQATISKEKKPCKVAVRERNLQFNCAFTVKSLEKMLKGSGLLSFCEVMKERKRYSV